MGSLAGEAVLVNYVLLAKFTDWAAGIPQIGGEARQIRLGEAILCVDSIRILSDWLGGGRVLAVGLGRYRDRRRRCFRPGSHSCRTRGNLGSEGRKGTWDRMGSIDRGTGRAVPGATASACIRPLPGASDSPLSHSQAMISGGVAPYFLLFDGLKGRPKRAAMYPRSVLSACAVSASKCSGATFLRGER